ncbi:GGDEF domain-containing protein [Paraglaciecola polaris]|uniref:diguanylate cyclase n=1 Tax=Paraglaciecola polaris LMG 21857 TaxID=1129793 RepID=K6YPV5_9ALTE|nr:GGDEF domain-containing protein [Paraglaciecola polaris]GAC34769.1 diguanylate cyclase [Paraglaciecola polaris LMG 21857]
MTDQLVQNIQYRRDVMRVLLIITFIGGCIFSVVNFQRGLWQLALIELVYGLFSLWLWRRILTTEHFQRWVTIYVVPFFIIMIYGLSVPQSSESIFVWILTIPVISYLLMGRKQGFWFSLTFIICGILAYHWRFISTEHNFSLNVAISVNVILSSFLMMTFAHVYEKNREQNEDRLLSLAGTDPLTGLANRMKLNESFHQLSALAARHQDPLTVVLFDLDLFKSINDVHGHAVGDDALRHVANFLQKNTRKSDLLARFGGEEFALLMVATDIDKGHQQVNALRKLLMKTPFTTQKCEIQITLSAGIASFGQDGHDLDNLLDKADKRLYFAKENGRNQVISQDPITANGTGNLKV